MQETNEVRRAGCGCVGLLSAYFLGCYSALLVMFLRTRSEEPLLAADFVKMLLAPIYFPVDICIAVYVRLFVTELYVEMGSVTLGLGVFIASTVIVFLAARVGLPDRVICACCSLAIVVELLLFIVAMQ